MSHLRIQGIGKAFCPNCEHLFFIMEPGAAYDLFKGSSPDWVVCTEPKEGACPHCGAPTIMPPAEMLEPCRTPWGRWLEKMDKQMTDDDDADGPMVGPDPNDEIPF